MNSVLTNWKTSLAGMVLMLIGVLGAAFGVHIPGFAMDPGVAIATGLGLLLAKDGNVTGGNGALSLAFAALCFEMLSLGYARAGDVLPAATMPVKAPPANPFAYPSGSGFYFGVGTVGGGGTANVSAPGVNSASLVTNQIGVAGIVGYVWGVKNSPAFAACELWGGWNNFNGSAPGFSFSGPAQFTERCIVGAPTDQIFSVFPSVFNPATFSPPPFTLPAGQAVITSKAYAGVELTEKDVSANVGAMSNRQWTVAPAITFGVLNILTKGSVIDTGVAIEFDDKGVCVGGGAGCGKVSTTYLARVAFKW